MCHRLLDSEPLPGQDVGQDDSVLQEHTYLVQALELGSGLGLESELGSGLDSGSGLGSGLMLG